MGFDRLSGSSATNPEMKTHVEPMEYDERNHSIAPSTRNLSSNAADLMRRNASAKLANPLAGISHAQLEEMGATYARKHHIGDEEDIRAFQKGAVLAQDPRKFAQVQGLTGKEKETLQKEFENRWSQPKLMYIVIALCSTCAAVQGMGQWHSSVYHHAPIFQLTCEQMRRLSTGDNCFTGINSVLTVKIRAPLGSLAY